MIEIVAAERGIACGREYLEHAARELENREIERAAAEIVDCEEAFRRVVEPVGDRCRGRFIEEPQHVEPCEPPRILGRLSLGIVEVSWNRDHRAIERSA